MSSTHHYEKQPRNQSTKQKDAALHSLEHEPPKLQYHFDSINSLQPLPNSHPKVQFKQGSK